MGRKPPCPEYGQLVEVTTPDADGRVICTQCGASLRVKRGDTFSLEPSAPEAFPPPAPKPPPNAVPDDELLPALDPWIVADP
jgi:hypothetical protein